MVASLLVATYHAHTSSKDTRPPDPRTHGTLPEAQRCPALPAAVVALTYY